MFINGKEIINLTPHTVTILSRNTMQPIAVFPSEGNARCKQTTEIFGNIGDSSGYVMKNQKIHKVTKDHTLVNLLVEAGNLTEEEAKSHPKKNVLMRALGATEKIEIDIFDVDMNNDGILLCSDGLTTMLTDDQIEKVLNDNELSTEEKVTKLIQKCNVRGGFDNISIAYLEKKEVND